VGVLSFGGSKLLTAGRGGAILTRHPDVHQRAKIYCERGNHAYPLSELQAAVLLPQLAKLDARNARRRVGVQQLLAGIRDLPGLRPVVNRAEPAEPVYYKLGFYYDADQLRGQSRQEFIAAVQAEGVAIDAGFRGFVHRGSRRCRRGGPLPHSKAAAAALLVLHHPVLLEPPEVIQRVALALAKVTRAFEAGDDVNPSAVQSDRAPA
jgi:dTDP-4-amino-4,6-dideoxygalactose transaminase